MKMSTLTRWAAPPSATHGTAIPLDQAPALIARILRDHPAAAKDFRLHLKSAEHLPRAAAERAREPFVRQLCWRDFYAQILFAQPRTQVEDMRPRGDHWLDDPDGLAAWKEGLTGYPLVDAGMRQLLPPIREGLKLLP